MTKFKKHKNKTGFVISRYNPFCRQSYRVKEDEYEWATDWRKVRKLFDWHHNHGLHRGYEHPMGKDLNELMREYNQYHVDRYKASGMNPPQVYLTDGVV